MTRIELSINEIAARLEVSERTALRRIQGGILAVERVGSNRYLVELADIHALNPRAAVADLAVEIAALSARIADMERQSADMAERMDAFAERVILLLQRPEPAPRTSSDVPAREKRPAHEEEGEEIGMQEMATRIGVNRSTLLEFVKRNHIGHQARPHPTRQGEMIRTFTVEQARALHEIYAQRKRRYMKQ